MEKEGEEYEDMENGKLIYSRKRRIRKHEEEEDGGGKSIQGERGWGGK